MNRETRDKFASRTLAVDSKNARWETAPKVFEKLNADFGPFDLDLTANSRNALLPRWLGPDSALAVDALSADWSLYGVNGYSNPSYYTPFVTRMLARAEMMRANGFESTLLLPLRITRAFRKHVLRGATQLLFCDKRLVFFEDGVPRCSQDKRGKWRPDTAMFDSIIVRYVPGKPVCEFADVGEWQVPVHVTQDDIDRYVQSRPVLSLREELLDVVGP